MKEAMNHGVDMGSVWDANKGEVFSKGVVSLVIVIIVAVVGCLWLFC